ncbi:hypothetical protein GYMLUDRAFT_389604 [Collybiopsis luxurians FD-317 M1]|nr:hypothetical protein GYMLUDRAFT_389604 [Collybiopsis luxurians FD-317 M1]
MNAVNRRSDQPIRFLDSEVVTIQSTSTELHTTFLTVFTTTITTAHTSISTNNVSESSSSSFFTTSTHSSFTSDTLEPVPSASTISDFSISSIPVITPTLSSLSTSSLPLPSDTNRLYWTSLTTDSLQTPTRTATSEALYPTTSQSTSATPSTVTRTSSKLNTTLIAGVIVGTAIALLLIIMLVVYVVIRRHRARLGSEPPRRMNSISSFGDSIIQAIRRSTHTSLERLSHLSSDGWRELEGGDDSRASRSTPSSTGATYHHRSASSSVSIVQKPQRRKSPPGSASNAITVNPTESARLPIVPADGSNSSPPNFALIGESPPPLYNINCCEGEMQVNYSPPTPYEWLHPQLSS